MARRAAASLLLVLTFTGCYKSMIEREVAAIGTSQQKVRLKDGAVIKAHTADGKV